MRGLLFLLFLSVSVLPRLAAQEQQSGVIALKDGRMVAIQGEYQVYGDEVQFTDSQGRLMTLPMKKVDLEETDRRNKLIREGRSSELAGKDPKKGPVIYKPPPKPVAEEPEKKSDTKTAADPGAVLEKLQSAQEAFRNRDPAMGLAYEDLREINEALAKDIGPWFATFSLIAVGLFLFSIFVNLMTRIWILVLAWQDSGTWFMSLIGLWLASFACAAVYSVVFAQVLALLSMVAVCVFVLLNCHGRRFLLLALYSSPIWVSFLLGLVFAGMIMFVG